jgi:hypothetical protein
MIEPDTFGSLFRTFDRLQLHIIHYRFPAAKLSRVYTNHCIRATCITLLSEAGFEGRHIITLSGHRSEEGIKGYCRDTSEEQKRDMSKSISAFTTVVNDTVRQSSVVENAGPSTQIFSL